MDNIPFELRVMARGIAGNADEADKHPEVLLLRAAADQIEKFEKALEIVQFELSPGPDAARSLAARVRVARRTLDRLPLIGSPAGGGSEHGKG